MTAQPPHSPVLIRADASDRIGLGHVKRCAALALALGDMEVPPVFVSYAEDAVAKAALKPLGGPQIRLDATFNTNDDLTATLAAAKHHQVQIIVIDSYDVDETYFHACHDDGLLIAYFEDFGRDDWPVDAVINGLIGAETLGYQSPHQLLGTDFMVLGPEYRAPEPDKSRDDDPLEIMITVGGIDHYDLTSRTLALLDTMDQELKIQVVVGPYFENEDRIKAVAAQCRHRTFIHKQPDSLAPIIGRCGMAVSAGGMTLYELATFGVPTVGIWLWENQRQNVERLSEAGVIWPLGYEKGAGFDETLGLAIGDLLEDRDRRRQLSRAGTDLVDGQGAHRVAAALVELSAQSRQPLQKVE